MIRKCSIIALRVVFSTLLIAVLLVAGTASNVVAAPTTLQAPTSLSGSQLLSTTTIEVKDTDGVTWVQFDSVTDVAWTQPAVLNTAYNTDLVRQGRSVDPSDSYGRPADGSMVVTWSLTNLEVFYADLGGISDQSISASGPCPLAASGAAYTCHLESDGILLFDGRTLPPPGPNPYVEIYLIADVTVTPHAIDTISQATIGGVDYDPASLQLSESPITDPLAISCGVGAGDDLVYTLGTLSTTPDIDVSTSIRVEFGTVEWFFDWFFTELPWSPIDMSLDSVSSSIAMTGPGATFDMGEVLPNNIPPVANPGGPYSGNEGSAIVFDGSGSSSVCGFPTLRWDFSDGGVAYGTNPQHTFLSSGVKSGLLTATDMTGLVSTATFTVDVTNLVPVANAGPDMSAKWGVPIMLAGSAFDPGTADDQPYLSYKWDFGDGTPSASGGASATHVYSVPGTYTATLTATDPEGASGTDTTQIIVAKRGTTLGYSGPLSSQPSQKVTLRAVLADDTGNKLAGRPVAFTLGTQGPFIAMTDSNGVASYDLKLGQKTGTYQLTVTFIPATTDATKYVGSSTSVPFTISTKKK